MERRLSVSSIGRSFAMVQYCIVARACPSLSQPVVVDICVVPCPFPVFLTSFSHHTLSCVLSPPYGLSWVRTIAVDEKHQ